MPSSLACTAFRVRNPDPLMTLFAGVRGRNLLPVDVRLVLLDHSRVMSCSVTSQSRSALIARREGDYLAVIFAIPTRSVLVTAVVLNVLFSRAAASGLISTRVPSRTASPEASLDRGLSVVPSKLKM